MLFGKEKIVPTDSVHNLIDELIMGDQKYSQVYTELPFCFISDRYGDNLEYKIVGFSRCENYIWLHAHSVNNDKEYVHEEKHNFDINLEMLAQLVDLL